MNKFYIIQIIKKAKKYICFTRWGGVGEKGTWFEYNGTNEAEDAVKKFKEIFRSKTRNNWEKRHAFRSYYRRRYTWIEKDDEEKGGGRYCNLHPRTCKLIRLIHAEEILCDNNIEDNRLPYQISRLQCQKGLRVLDEIETAVSRKKPKKLLQDLSSKFFSLIPHKFHFEKLPILDTVEGLESKREILLEFSKVKDRIASGFHATRVLYDQLRCDLRRERETSPAFKLISKFAAASKPRNGRRIVDLWRVERQGEKERFAPHAGLPNRKLLWHGTKAWCVAPILKQGLRILPHSRGTFGRGLYFASECEKSAGYASTCHFEGESVSFMFLVEVALGTPFETAQGDSSLTRAPAGYGSVVGRGRTEPDPQGDKTLALDGHEVTVPAGAPVPQQEWSGSSVEKSEYLIYQESQAQLRFLIKFSSL
ncbi:protein mono-ADP-ribosyltransferase PARP3-like isoform X2 [Penaeus chinensis]|uniref:protein mono-ADP-ribosyltransferase PARP3-like isoform X2 n=1 Tax=Penaeus chinensis TaxID=139456 RepID=UPI001FB5FEC4|nr:protein mono-ADP-ribosyltransferase PARP3-like isoform X2 [Penaeus chinensis]